MPRRLVRTAALAALAAAASGCGNSELEAALAAAQAERESLARDHEAEARVALEKQRAAATRASEARARADALAAEVAEKTDALAAARTALAAEKVRAEKAKKDLERLIAHRDELTEWIEKELLPIAEEHRPDLVNLREATAEMQKAVEEIRGLPWKAPVMRRRIDRAQLGDWMQRDMRKELPPDKAFEIVTAGAEMGLVKPGTDLYAMFTEFMTAGAAAFYKPDTRTFYHIEGNDGRGAYPVVFHELVHALEDQYFDLDLFYRVVEDDTDRALARRAVVEGSASYWQDLYQAKHPEDLKEMMRSQMTPDMLKRQQQMILKVPAFLVATIGLYPYNNCKTWVGKVTGGDPAKLAALYTDPPESTEQVLHPEKFADPATRDYPHKVPAPDVSSLPADWKRLDSDSMGELTTGCLLAQLRFPAPFAFVNVLDASSGGVAFRDATKTAVTGWDGDRYSCVVDPADGRATILWVSVWDTEKDAQEFADIYAALVGKKVTGVAVTALPEPVRFSEAGTGRVSAIERKGTLVVAVLGAAPERLDALLAAGLATKVEADPRDAADTAATSVK